MASLRNNSNADARARAFLLHIAVHGTFGIRVCRL